MPDVTPSDYVELRELAADHLPPAPAAGRRRIYADADGILQTLGAAAPVAPLVPEGGGAGTAIATGSGAPTPPSEATIATQELSINADDPYVGTFKIGFDGEETPEINVATATVDDIVALLEALPGIGAGNIVDTNGNGPYTLDDAGSLYLEFVGDLAGQAVPLLEVVDLDMTGNGTPIAPEDFAFAVVNEGAPAGAGTPADPTDGQLYLDLDASALYEYRGGDGFWLDVAQGTVDAHEEAADPHTGYASADALAAAVTAHEELEDAHDGYATDSELVEALTAHGVGADPHSVYATDAEVADVMDTHMNTSGLHDGLTYSGIADPSAGAGVAANQGNLYQRLNGSAGELWLKTGAGDPDWTLLGSAALHGFYGETPSAQPAPVADATSAVDVVTRFNELMSRLRVLGLIDT